MPNHHFCPINNNTRSRLFVALLDKSRLFVKISFMDTSYSAKILSGVDVDMIQYSQNYISILDTINADKIIQDRLEFTKLDEQQRAKFSSPFLNFLSIHEEFNEVIEQLKVLLESTKELAEHTRNAWLREYLFDQQSGEPTPAKIILDGLVGFYSSPLGGLMKKKDYFSGLACCHGVLSLIPGNKAPCNYIVRPERVHKALGGTLWHGQPNLRSDRTRVGLCPTCMTSLLRNRIGFRLSYLTKLRTSLANNKNSSLAQLGAEKERQLTRELESLQSDLEKISHIVLEAEDEEKDTVWPNDAQAMQTSSEDDAELMSLLQEPVIDLTKSREEKEKQDKDLTFSQEEFNSSEQKVSTARVQANKPKRVTRAATKKAERSKANAKEEETPAQQNESALNELGTSQESPISNKRTGNIENNTNAPPGQKRKRKEDDQNSSNKRQKKQPTVGSANKNTVRNVNALSGDYALTIRIEELQCTYPLTVSQVFLFDAIATLLSPDFTRDPKRRAKYLDSMEQVDLATLVHMKDMLSLTYDKRCEKLGLK